LEYRFGPFTLAFDRRELARDGERIHLAPRSSDLLIELVRCAPELVTKDELFRRVWSDATVVDGALSVAMADLRRALGDSARDPVYIETVHRRGYRFKAAIDREGDEIASSAGVAMPIVGRSAQMAWLEGALALARTGRRQIVFPVGEPGIGKTTMAEVFLAQASAQGDILIGEGRCIERHVLGEPYLPILDALTRLARGDDGERVAATLARFAPSWGAHLPITQAPHIEPAAEPMSALRLLREISETLEALSQERPLILFLDDLHWADHATIDLVNWLARRQESAQLMLIGAFRPGDAIESQHPVHELSRELSARGLASTESLPLFEEAAVSEYLSARFQCAADPSTAAFVLDRSEGNPLFVTAVTDQLVADDAVGENAKLRPERIRDRVVSDDVGGFIQDLIARISIEERRAMEVGSVIGARFSADHVAQVLDADVGAIERVLGSARITSRFLRDAGSALTATGPASRFEFQHALYRSALLSGIPAGERARLHWRVGEILESDSAIDTSERASTIALHFDAAGDAERALRYLTQAAGDAVQWGATAEAVEYLNRALKWLRVLPATPERVEQEMGVYATLLPALVVHRGYASPEMSEALGHCQRLSEEGGDSPQSVLIAMGFWLHAAMSGDYEFSYTLAERAARLARSLEAEWLQLAALQAVGISAHLLGRLDEADARLSEAVAIYDPQMHGDLTRLFGGDPGPVALAYLAWNDQCAGRVNLANQRISEAKRLAVRYRHDPTTVIVQFLYFWILYTQRRFEALPTEIDLLVDLAREGEFPMWRAIGVVARGTLAVATGNLEGGLAELELGVQAYQKTGAQLGNEHTWCFEIEALARAGRPLEAIERADALLSSVQGRRRQVFLPELLRLRGTIGFQALSAGLVPDDRRKVAESEARNALARAVEEADALGAHWYGLRARMDFARIERATGDVGVAAERVDEGLAAVDSSVDLPDIVDGRILQVSLRS
jgi:predicted ATPase/DNA-binding winged helix-turn-helix (wHTH) protein